ncbi:cytoplasmic protein [Sporosarcina pasteurii]|nr:glutamine amidotransferase [Sporosarcina pasteurii]MDS9472611.1 glutamine amidotransferase [Sporosarcina pasteurii]QBQ06158.1 cytoplasmic protein [Sporosarcina pasteurii]
MELKSLRVLFIGDSWTIHMIHTKGFDSFESTKYEEGATHLLNCLREGGVDVDYMPAHEVQVRFPKSVSELEIYDAIVISDIGANTFLLQNATFYDMESVPNALSMIKEYVENGGGLLMVGGYLSFSGIEGKANYSNTVIADVLPVIMKEGDDRFEAPEGVRPRNTETKHFITENIDQWPAYLGYNRFKAKPDATVLVETERDPFLVLGEYKGGKTACFASDCAPHWWPKQSLNWEHYQDLWINILKYVADAK